MRKGRARTIVECVVAAIVGLLIIGYFGDAAIAGLMSLSHLLRDLSRSLP